VISCRHTFVFRARLRHDANFKAVLRGLNASAIGLVGAACVVLWEAAITGAADAIVFSVALTMTAVWDVPAPICIVAGGVLGAILHPDALDLGQRPYCVQQGYTLSATTMG
jgi:chromate transporter